MDGDIHQSKLAIRSKKRKSPKLILSNITIPYFFSRPRDLLLDCVGGKLAIARRDISISAPGALSRNINLASRNRSTTNRFLPTRLLLMRSLMQENMDRAFI